MEALPKNIRKARECYLSKGIEVKSKGNCRVFKDRDSKGKPKAGNYTVVYEQQEDTNFTILAEVVTND